MSRVVVTGAAGLVGSAIVRRLNREKDFQCIPLTRNECDLLRADETTQCIEEFQPDVIIAAAAVVGGIKANMASPVKFLHENIMMQNNLMLAAKRHRVSRFVFLASSCIYPRLTPQPMNIRDLMSGPLEPTNESYAMAKLVGIQMMRAISAETDMQTLVPIPPNIYGPNDHFDLHRAHVLSSLVHRFCRAVDSNQEEVAIWGTGNVRREFMHSDDLADAILFLLRHDRPAFLINVGAGFDVSIREAAELVSRLSGFKGRIVFDVTQPEGMAQKLLNSEELFSMGWKPGIGLESGLADLITEFRVKWAAS